MANITTPNSSNNYFVIFDARRHWCLKESGPLPWAPNLQTTLPFVPKENKDLAHQFYQSTNSRSFDSIVFENSCTQVDVFSIISADLDPKDLGNFSEVSKSCYLATKTDTVWSIQLQKLFPDVMISPRKNFSLGSEKQHQIVFDPEKQFQIVFHLIKQTKKPYEIQVKFERTEAVACIAKAMSDQCVDYLNSIKKCFREDKNVIEFENYQGPVLQFFKLYIPDPIQNEIYQIHCDIIKSMKHLQNDYWGCAEHAFPLKIGQWSDNRVKVQSIEQFIDEKKSMVFAYFVSEIRNGSFKDIKSGINEQIQLCEFALKSIPLEFNNQEKFDAAVEAAVESRVLPKKNCVIL
jgi:hypothetical protein